MPSSRIFRSRWSALFWAAGILWFAYDVASGATPDRPAANATDAAGAPVNDADVAALANEMMR